jgi:hypothetical protein
MIFVCIGLDLARTQAVYGHDDVTDSVWIAAVFNIWFLFSSEPCDCGKQKAPMGAEHLALFQRREKSRNSSNELNEKKPSTHTHTQDHCKQTGKTQRCH